MGKEEEIRVIAYIIWVEEGCCNGRDLDHWLRAEAIWVAQQKPGRDEGSQIVAEGTTASHTGQEVLPGTKSCQATAPAPKPTPRQATTRKKAE